MNRSRAEWDHLSPGERAQKLSRAGAPALGVQLRTDDEGEVLARSNHCLLGYWEQPEATADAIVDGWFRTGDGGFIDDESYLTISDRKKDVIITGGENVSSIEVEDRLFSHPAVAEVAVVGRPPREVGRDGHGPRGARARRGGDRGRPHRLVPRRPGPLQVPDRRRVPRRARPDGHRQAPEVQARAPPTGRAATARSTDRRPDAAPPPRALHLPATHRAPGHPTRAQVAASRSRSTRRGRRRTDPSWP